MKEHQFAYLANRTDIRGCCRNVASLRLVKMNAHVMKAYCRKCGTEHINMRADPFKVSSAISGLGRMKKKGSLLVPGDLD
jgi:hypothetical protein